MPGKFSCISSAKPVPETPSPAFAHGQHPGDCGCLRLFIGIALGGGWLAVSRSSAADGREFLELLLQIIGWIIAPGRLLGIMAVAIRLVAEQDVSLLVDHARLYCVVFAYHPCSTVSSAWPGYLFLVLLGQIPAGVFWRAGSREA